MSKSKSNSRSVRGPQVALSLGKARKGKAPAPAIEERTPVMPSGSGEPQRVRYLEAPTKPDGNPFMAFRVPADLRDGFKRFARSKDATPADLIRAYMAKASGVELGGENE